MGKQIIILDKTFDINDKAFNVIFWCSVPVSRQKFYADPNFKSAYIDASAGEISSLQSGAVVEIPYKVVHIDTKPLADIKSELISAFTDAQNQITNTNYWGKYGMYYDGSSWTTGGVA